MTWWQKLQSNPLARFGATILLVFYIAVIFADFVAPYGPYEFQPNGSLLPPTPIYWRNQAGEFIGPHVYPTTQGPVDLETGDRPLMIDRDRPSPLRLLPPSKPYKLWRIIPLDRHLFGTVGGGYLNLLGTDDQARDQVSRLLHGGRVSLFIGLIGVGIAFPIGLLVGGIAGYFGGWIDSVLMGIVEVLMIFPSIYLIIAFRAAFFEAFSALGNAQIFLFIVSITALISWSGLARVIRGEVLSLKERTYVQAAKAMGASSLSIIVRHILPQTATYVITAATLSIPSFIIVEAILSIVGLGIQQPDPSWGNMLSLAINPSIIVLQPWLIWPPAILIVLTVLAFNLLGDGLRDVLDPRNSEVS